MNFDTFDIDCYSVANIAIGCRLLGGCDEDAAAWKIHVEGNDWIAATPVNCCTS
jgi:hypothetical protein